MATGLPAGFPGYQTLPAMGMGMGVPAAPAPTPQSSSSLPFVGGDDGLWLSVTAVSLGSLITLGLLAWVAVGNTREHEQLRQEIGKTSQDLSVYKKEHAATHAALAATQAETDAVLQAQILALSMPRSLSMPPRSLSAPRMLSLPRTLSQVPVVSRMATTFAPPLSEDALLEAVALSYAPTLIANAPATRVSTPPSLTPSTQPAIVFSLPPHLEAAVSSALRRSQLPTQQYPV